MNRKASAFIYAIMICCGAPASARWHEASSKHFVIYSQQSPEKLREFATKLERYDKGVRLLRRLADSDSGKPNRLTIYILGDMQQVHRLATGQYVAPGKPMVAGFYHPSAGNSIAITWSSSDEDLNVLAQSHLFHEYAHHLMFENASGAFPRWYVEGFAEFNRTAKINADGSAGFGYPLGDRYDSMDNGPSVGIADLLSSRSKIRPEQLDTFYGKGWLLTHYLTFEKERAGQLEAYLKAFNAGKGDLETARSVFGDLDKLDRDLTRYFRQTRLSFIPIPASALTIEPISVREVSDGEDSIIPLRIRSKRGLTPADAPAVLASVKAAAKTYPADPAVQIELAEAAFDAGNDAESDAAADRILASDPGNVRAMIYKAMVALRRSEPKAPGGTVDTGGVQQARSWALKANRTDPLDPLPLILFYQTFVSIGAKPTDNALDGLFRAFELTPQDDGLRWMMARASIEDNQLPTARALLMPLAYSPHSATSRNVAAEIIDRIDAGQTTGLLDLVSKEQASAKASCLAFLGTGC